MISSVPRWLDAIILLGAAAMIFGAGAALFQPVLLLPNPPPTGGARYYATYFAIRNVVLGVAVVVATLRKTQSAPVVMLVTGLIQVCDAVFDVATHQWLMALCVAVFAMALFIANSRLRHSSSAQIGKI